MMSISSINDTLVAFTEIFPPKQEETKFDKILDLIKAFSSGTLVGTVGQVLETSIKTCGTIFNEKQRVQAVKYVRDAYELQCNAELEMKKLNIQSETNQVLTLYIERTFQKEIDEIQKRHIYNMQNLRDSKELAIYKMDRYARVQLENINQRYATIIRVNEASCLLYRQYLEYVKNSNESPAHLIAECSKAYMEIIKNAVFDKSIKMSEVQIGLDQIMKLLEFLGTTNNYFLPFENYIKQKKQLEVR